jgi:hypothetical protein
VAVAVGGSGFYPGVTQEWRIAEEGCPPPARRCQCPVPTEFADADGQVSCAKCGREPAFRLGAASDPRLDGFLPSSATCKPGRYMDQQLNFRADEDLARALAEAASREERTISAEIRYAVRKHLNESARPLEAGRSQSRALDQPANEA